MAVRVQKDLAFAQALREEAITKARRVSQAVMGVTRASISRCAACLACRNS